jgi:hypothetical protein
MVYGVMTNHSPEQVASIVSNFSAGTVPVLGHHHAPEAAGWLRSLAADGANLWFLAELTDASLAERVRLGAVSISIEMVAQDWRMLRPDEPGIVLSVSTIGWPDTFRGSYGPGWTMTGVAALRPGDRPGAKGSCMFAYVPAEGE